MPNWCTTYLTIRVPTALCGALLEALEGPSDWAMPSTQPALMMLPCIELSAHQSLALDGLMHGQNDAQKALRAQWVERLKAKRADSQMAPGWMPVSREDLRFFWYQENNLVPERYKEATVPLSLPKLAPWTDKGVFEHHFPGEVDSDGFWKPAGNRERSYNSGSLGPIAWRDAVLGVKWPPSDTTLCAEVEDSDGFTRVLFSYQTPWAPIDTLGAILSPVLAQHQAQALLFWQEEDRHTGWAYTNPAQGIDTRATWPRESFTVEAPDPHYPREIMWTWDSHAMAKSAQAAAQAPFTPLVMD
jgi:hypothetical protein